MKRPAPTLKPLDSSMLEGMAYDQASRDLTVRFKSGETYVVEGVSLERATSLEGAESPGRYFNKELKPHHVVRKV